jgi:RTX calcium-binding nonapeptide repeat (4 copies)
MRPRFGRYVLLALLAWAALPPTAAGQQGGVLELSGGPEPARIIAFVDAETAELVLRDAAGIEPPGQPCEPPPGTPTTEIRCPPGAIRAVVGNLGGGDDAFLAEPDLAVRIGARVDGTPQPLRGGAGSDLLRSGAAADLLLGGDGRDRILGRMGADLLRGGAGRDRIFAAAGGDALFGGSGADLLRGGPGPDLCRGGGGRDRFDSCALRR